MSQNVPKLETVPDGDRPGRKERFLLALLTARTIDEACEQAGIHRRTGLRWRQDPQFRKRLDEVRRQSFDHGIARIQGLSGKAVATLERALDCGQVNLEISAAGKLLDLATKYLELHDLTRRIQALEETRSEGSQQCSRLEAYLE